MPEQIPKLGVPEFTPVNFHILKTALTRGWSDFKRAPGFALVFAGTYILGGWFMLWITWLTGQSYWLVFAAIGFPLIAPFAAVGFYDVSRRISGGHAIDWMQIFSVILRQSKRQLPSLCAIIIVIFLFWFFLAHMIFALFLGLSTMTNVSTSMDIYFTSNGLMMLAFGSVIGAGFAALLYMITVLALPLLLDREVDFVSAMIASFQYVLTHPILMFGWALFIGFVTVVSMLPAFLGLFVTLPLLGHATWHLYDLLADRENT
ncbi:MAG: DUF2189 domain-containing protein [Pelagimonas sp.]